MLRRKVTSSLAASLSSEVSESADLSVSITSIALVLSWVGERVRIALERVGIALAHG